MSRIAKLGRLLLCLLLSVGAPLGAAPAPGGPGAVSTWAPAEKSFLGTAASAASRVYFTGHRGVVSEVFYPLLDTVNTVDLQFLVGDSARTFVDEEKRQSYSATQPNPRALRWQVVTANPARHWRIDKQVFTDPARPALIQRVTFEALDGRTLADFNLYLLHNPAMGNSGANDHARRLDLGGRTLLTASEGSRASALAVSRPWRSTGGGEPFVSAGFVGQSDGWTDLLGGPADRVMHWAYSSAGPGNVAQMGWIDLGVAGTRVSFDVVLAFGESEAQAGATANAVLASDPAAIQAAYDTGWQQYAATLDPQGGQADDQYYLAAMALKSIQDKSNGAMIAGMGTPWGETNGDANHGGYHLVWPRDLFKFANALLTAGDVTTAQEVTSYLFNTLQQTMDCGNAEYDATGCPQGYSRTGRFPQNAWVSGWQYWQGTQMDEQAMPIILAWRTYRLGNSGVKQAVNALWPRIKRTADYLAATGPWTQQERWEENSGYSPSTIAAEIAGLVAAAEFARLNRDTASAAHYLATADYWQQRVADWTFTRTGFHGDGRYYIRINPSRRGTGAGLQRFDPANGPDTALTFTHGNGGGSHDQRYIVDGGFLELVRLGVKRADDSTVLDTLPEYDALLRQSIAGRGDAWFRYNYDGYGERNDGGNYDGQNGRGRLWPIFTAERGMFEIARSGLGGNGAPYLAAVKAFSNPSGFIPEQVWNHSANITGWQTSLPAGYTAGTPTKSIAPLSWAMGEYISLVASMHAGRIADLPPETCARYATCIVPPLPGQVAVAFNATAGTSWGQQVYVTGNTDALGQWHTDLGLPADPRAYPLWQTRANLPAGHTVAYKYYRKERDGSVVWENYPGGGNRTLQVPANGSMIVNDAVNW
ncbi:glycoside hydrolase family 15 protein [Chitiniphilus purpureus]|uniref:Glycoside hydrolase family 15 protein n=1 Tax=Chitiniphilus purpureus TaxID=2981137 RepID=A0ABY6DQ63_9NEIS|nr:glycoside hydrolase family 15 protein [Chitiniphilus sp. CD1]UXY14053.1 glycoside hydrolase family 15 protein [Chitiniphilus sp. CD1]